LRPVLFAWQTGSGALAVRSSNVASGKQNLASQADRRRKTTIHMEFIAFLKCPDDP
jgi:hypothetical protein